MAYDHFPRKIIHLDMDAFFASVEQRDNQAYQGKPLIVGGSPEARGVVAAASYEARKFGIHSAMSSMVALRRCPQAIFVKPRIEVYRRISRVIMAVLRDYSDLVEPLSLDEAYVDVTHNKKGLRYATMVAADARRRIFEYTGLTASAGVSSNKFLAKIASDINKPNGLKVIRPEDVDSFLTPLPVRKIPGIGQKTEEKMLTIGIQTVAELRMRSQDELISLFGKAGTWYYQVARGQDDRPVIPARERKSIGAEDTFPIDTNDRDQIVEKIRQHTARVATSLCKRNTLGRTITLKVKYANFENQTRSRTLSHYTNSAREIEEIAISLLDQTEIASRPIRLVGVSLSNFEADDEERPLVTSSQLAFCF